MLQSRTVGLALAWIALGLTVAMVAIAAIRDLSWLVYAVQAVKYPFALDIAEGIVWQQATMIPGSDMYGDIARYPWIVFHYPPLYHLTVRALSTLGLDWLIAGRAVSLAATIATGPSIALLVLRAAPAQWDNRAKIAGAATAGLMYFCFDATIEWSSYFRVDTLGMLFIVLGLCLATARENGNRLLYLGIAAFTAAVYTKQTNLPAAIATVAVLAFATPKRARNACVFGIVLAGGLLIVMIAMTKGGFIRHLLFYNINRFEWRAAYWFLLKEHGLAGFAALAALGVPIWWYAMTRHRAPGPRAWLLADPRRRAGAILTLWLVLSTCSLIMLGKFGANRNYMLEWIGAVCVFSGIAIAWLTHISVSAIRGAGTNLPALIGAAALACTGLTQTAVLKLTRNSSIYDTTQIAELQILLTRVRAEPGPVLSDDMTMLMKSGKNVPWEPGIFRELALLGVWDEQPLLDMIAVKQFSAIVEADPTNWNDTVRAAIVRSYSPTGSLGGRTIFRPR